MVAIHGMVLTGIYETELQTAQMLPEFDPTASERITHYNHYRKNSSIGFKAPGIYVTTLQSPS